MTDFLYAWGTAKTWLDTGGDYAMDLTGLATATGRIGDQWDRGAGALEPYLAVRAIFRTGTNPTVGNILSLFIAASDSSALAPGDNGTTDATITSVDRLRNLDPIGVVIADEASTTRDFVFTGIIFCPYRYVSPVVWSTFGVTTSTTSAECSIVMTPGKRQTA